MNVWTAQRSRDESWDLLDVTATLDDAQNRCLADATPYKPFLDPRPPVPVLSWRRSYLAEDADDPDEQSDCSWYTDHRGNTYCVTEWEV